MQQQNNKQMDFNTNLGRNKSFDGNNNFGMGGQNNNQRIDLNGNRNYFVESNYNQRKNFKCYIQWIRL